MSEHLIQPSVPLVFEKFKEQLAKVLRLDERTSGYVVVYKNRPQYQGLDSYLVLDVVGPTRTGRLENATLFDSHLSAERAAADNRQPPEDTKEPAVVARVETVTTRRVLWTNPAASSSPPPP